MFTKKSLLILLFIVLTCYLLRPYIYILLTASIFAIVINPVVNTLVIKNHQISSLFWSVFFCLLILVPISLALYFAVAEVHFYLTHYDVPQQINNYLKDHLVGSSALGQAIYDKINNIDWQKDVFDKFNFANLNSSLPVAKNALAFMVGMIVNFFLLFIFLFNLLIYRDKIKSFFLHQVLDTFKSPHQLIGHIVNSVRAVSSSLLATALLVGVCMSITYSLVGVPVPLFLGLITALLALIPFTLPIFYILLSSIYFLQGNIFTGLIILIVGLALNFITDNIIQPKLLQQQTQMRFVVSLLGILAGLETFGLLGVFLGPVILNLAVALIRDQEK